MTSSPRSGSPLVLISLVMLVWTVLLAAWLRYLLGTEISLNWLTVGLTVTLIAVGHVLLAKEMMDAVPLLNFVRAEERQPREARTARQKPLAEGRGQSIDPNGSQRYRSELGLLPGYVLSNRRRSPRWVRF